MRTLSSMLIVCMACTSIACAHEPDFKKVEIKTTKAADGVYMLEGEGGNIGVSVGDDGVLVVDDQFAPLTPKIQAAIAALTKKPIRFVLNTHWHADHVGGNENLAAAGAVIVAHDNARKRMSVGQFMQHLGRQIPPMAPKGLPVVTFAADVTFHFNGDTIHVFHVDPAHTDGDSIVHFTKANVIHTGDCFITTGYPRVDIGSGGDFLGVLAVADKLVAIADDGTRIIPGHGAVSGKAALREWRDMLATIRERVQKLLLAKKSLAEVQAAKPTAEFDAKMSEGSVEAKTLVETAYRALTSSPAPSRP